MTDAAQTTGKIILLVDDEDYMLQVLERRLTASGYRVLMAHNGVEALEVVSSTRPDLILLDAMMPKMNGLDTCLRLKSQEATRDIPIIMLTANVSPKLREDVLIAGALACIYKPFGSKELLSIIEAGLRGEIQSD